MAEDRTGADVSGKGESVTVPLSADPFGALAEEGEKLQQPSVADPISDPVAVAAPSICQQGPCRHHSVVRFPSGIAAGQTLIVVDKHYCERGVVFPETSIGGRMLLGTVSTLPTDCSSWAPMTEIELEEQADRRTGSQGRIATKLAAEAVQQDTNDFPEDKEMEEVPLPNLEDALNKIVEDR